MKNFKFKEDINLLFTKDEESYEKRLNEINEYLKQDIDNRHDKCLISFNGETKKEITLGQYYSYLIVLEPFYVYDESIQLDIIPDITNIKNIENYFDWCIDYFGVQLGYTDIGEVIVDIIDRLNNISCDMTEHFGPTFDLHTFIKLAERNERFKEILYEPEKYIEENKIDLSPEDIINYTHKIVDEIEEILVNDDENNFKYFITSGAGINMKQLGQTLGFIGLKPDLKEKIIPMPIATNFCKGLRDVTDYYINAVGCLKALITVKIQTKNSGYLTRKIQILLGDEYIEDVEDCGTKHLLPFTIENKTHLLHLNNLYYSVKSNGTNLKKISYKDKNLIGKTVYLRTPITCACKGICKKCYGGMSVFNKNMNIGIIASLVITNSITQTSLSVKHLLQAAILSSIDPIIHKYFNINIDKISIKEEYIDKISLAFNRDLDMDENDEYQITNFSIIDNGNLIDIDTNFILNINPEMNDLIKSDVNMDLDKFVVKCKKLKNIDYIFYYSVDNNSLSGPMLKLKEILEKKKLISEYDIFTLFKKIIDILIEAKSSNDYLHIAVLIRNLITVEGGREKFREKEFPKYNLYCISDAIQYSDNGVSKPLFFERIKDQLLTDKYNTLNKRGTSNYDYLLK